MLLSNLRVKAGLVNGSRGVVDAFAPIKLYLQQVNVLVLCLVRSWHLQQHTSVDCMLCLQEDRQNITSRRSIGNASIQRVSSKPLRLEARKCEIIHWMSRDTL